VYVSVITRRTQSTTRNELQSNEVSISRVWPCIQYLKTTLINNIDDYKYTKSLRRDLLASVNKRFDDLIENDVFVVATFLDPFFGAKAFDAEKRAIVKNRIKMLLSQFSSSSSKDKVRVVNKCPDKPSPYIFFDNELSPKVKDDCLNVTIKDYVDFAEVFQVTLVLSFWKTFQTKFPELSRLAKKYLGVQAS